MKTLTLASLLIFLGTSIWAMPSSITYQGSLKEQGAPVNGTRHMLFRLTDASGSTVYWTSAILPVTITQGLFAVVLSPTGVDWQSISPYLETSVEGQQLLPREPITAGAYAFMSSAVMDGSVSIQKLDAAAQSMLVPSGLIGIFAGSCPSGWTRFADLDNYFPMGSSAFGTTGGQASHEHTIPGSGVLTTGAATSNDWVSAQATDRNVARIDHVHAIPSHNHGGWTGSASNLPPYKTVVFCQKQ